MGDFEKYLLELAYNNYLKTDELEFRFVPQNSNDLIHAINSLNFLNDDGYVTILSDNLDKNTLKVWDRGHISSDMVFAYELTDKGLSFIRNLKT